MFKSISSLFVSIANKPDDLIANRYQLKKLIGKGAMGQVYCAADRKLGNTNVAIKFLSQTFLDQNMRSRFEKEAKLSALLGEQSINIVKVKDYGLDTHNIPFYVMEFLEGYSLDKIIKTKTLSLGKFLSLTRQICLALECAHNGIVVEGELCPIIHRDIKPSNIFVVQDPALGNLVKILDFGIAQIINPSESASQHFMGTPKYCSPEQMAEEELDPRSDIYSLGIMMYEMLAKETPIKAENDNFQAWYHAHHKFMPKPLPDYLNLPTNLETTIMSCLEKSPDKRPQSAVEILKVINYLEQKDKYISNHVRVSKKTVSKKNLPLQERYRQSSWPSDKPQQKIVFPVLTESNEGVFASLWTMLETENILKYNPSATFCYNHFLFQASPHPMLLWLNLLYSREQEAKWLPCYLDLKTELGNKIVNNLVKCEVYYILLFALNQPEGYQEIIRVSLSKNKIKELQNYGEKSIFCRDKSQPEASKRILKKEFEQLQLQILETIKRVDAKLTSPSR
jgi:serine/threonine-protein kinase